MNSTVNYRIQTEEDLFEAFTKLGQFGSSERSFKAYTGSEGLKSFHSTLRKALLEQELDLLNSDKLITREEYKRLNDMIYSKDERDETLAEIIIETKRKEYESNI